MKTAIIAESNAKPALETTCVAALDLGVELDPDEPPISLDGAAVATACNPPVTAPWSVSTGALLPRATAAALKLSKVFPVAGALMLPTIPEAQ